MGQAAACCTAREACDTEDIPSARRRHRSAGGAVSSTDNDVSSMDSEEHNLFFECAETEDDLFRLLRGQLPLEVDIHADVVNSRECMFVDLDPRTFDAMAQSIVERAREEWRSRVTKGISACRYLGEVLREGCPELEWASHSAGRRMLRAMQGDEQKAFEMLVQAIEFRFRDRQLFSSMCCQANADIRIIGKDVNEQPAVYMCARSQTDREAPLKDIRDQLVLAFEAGCRLTTEEGTVVFLADMYGLRPRLNADFGSLRDLADVLGTIYAERIAQVLVVDFSRAAQFLWYLLKPMLSEKTRSKFAFVSAAEAKKMCERQFKPEVFERICSSMDINRNPKSTPEDRAQHARLTAACDVPLRPPANGEVRVVL